MKTPWYVKMLYNKEKDCYILKVNKWWAVWRYIQINLFFRWVRRNSTLVNWHTLTDDKEIENGMKYWKTPTKKDFDLLTHYGVKEP